MTKAILVNSIGSIEYSPILNHLYTPLISGAKKNNKNKETKERKKRKRIK